MEKKVILGRKFKTEASCYVFGEKSFQLFATGTANKKIHVWHINKDKPIRTLISKTTNPFKVNSLTFTSYENNLLSGLSNGAVQYWSLEKQEVIATYLKDFNPILCVNNHPLGKYFATGSQDSKIRVWDCRNPKKSLQTYKGHYFPITFVKFTPDGRWLVSGDDNGIVRLWDLTAGKMRCQFSGHYDCITAITFHPSDFVCAICSREGTLSLWDLDNNKLISTITKSSPIHSCLFDYSGRILLACRDESLDAIKWEPNMKTWDSVKCNWENQKAIISNEEKNDQILTLSSNPKNKDVYLHTFNLKLFRKWEEVTDENYVDIEEDEVTEESLEKQKNLSVLKDKMKKIGDDLDMNNLIKDFRKMRDRLDNNDLSNEERKKKRDMSIQQKKNVIERVKKMKMIQKEREDKRLLEIKKKAQLEQMKREAEAKRIRDEIEKKKEQEKLHKLYVYKKQQEKLEEEKERKKIEEEERKRLEFERIEKERVRKQIEMREIEEEKRREEEYQRLKKEVEEKERERELELERIKEIEKQKQKKLEEEKKRKKFQLEQKRRIKELEEEKERLIQLELQNEKKLEKKINEEDEEKIEESPTRSKRKWNTLAERRKQLKAKKQLIKQGSGTTLSAKLKQLEITKQNYHKQKLEKEKNEKDENGVDLPFEAKIDFKIMNDDEVVGTPLSEEPNETVYVLQDLKKNPIPQTTNPKVLVVNSYQELDQEESFEKKETEFVMSNSYIQDSFTEEEFTVIENDTIKDAEEIQKKEIKKEIVTPPKVEKKKPTPAPISKTENTPKVEKSKSKVDSSSGYDYLLFNKNKKMKKKYKSFIPTERRTCVNLNFSDYLPKKKKIQDKTDNDIITRLGKEHFQVYSKLQKRLIVWKNFKKKYFEGERVLALKSLSEDKNADSETSFSILSMIFKKDKKYITLEYFRHMLEIVCNIIKKLKEQSLSETIRMVHSLLNEFSTIITKNIIEIDQSKMDFSQEERIERCKSVRNNLLRLEKILCGMKRKCKNEIDDLLADIAFFH